MSTWLMKIVLNLVVIVAMPFVLIAIAVMYSYDRLGDWIGGKL